MYTITNVFKRDNLLLAYKRLINNNPENTYKNYFRYSYSVYSMALEHNIDYLKKKLKSGYLPGEPIKVFMLKVNGLSRMYTLLTIEDQIVYQAYANIIGDAISVLSEVTSRYKRLVFGNLYAGKQSEFFITYGLPFTTKKLFCGK